MILFANAYINQTNPIPSRGGIAPIAKKIAKIRCESVKRLLSDVLPKKRLSMTRIAVKVNTKISGISFKTNFLALKHSINCDMIIISATINGVPSQFKISSINS